jgi:LemA protein
MVWLVLLIFIAPAAIFIGAYNRLLTERRVLRNAFAQIDVLLTRRHELLPSVIASVREHLADEHRALDALLADCQAAHEGLNSASADQGGADAVQRMGDVDRRLGGALVALRALLLRHPELEAVGAKVALTEELATTEHRVAAARQTYNSAVLAYNTSRQSFPGSLAAGYFGFTPAYPLPAAQGPVGYVPVPASEVGKTA